MSMKSIPCLRSIYLMEKGKCLDCPTGQSRSSWRESPPPKQYRYSEGDDQRGTCNEAGQGSGATDLSTGAISQVSSERKRETCWWRLYLLLVLYKTQYCLGPFVSPTQSLSIQRPQMSLVKPLPVDSHQADSTSWYVTRSLLLTPVLVATCCGR